MVSGSVSKALVLTFGEEAHETATFVEKMDYFFDFNVSSFTEKQKPFWHPTAAAIIFDSRCVLCLYMHMCTFVYAYLLVLCFIGVFQITTLSSFSKN